ncbi:uncharacterized protein JN550_003214 [Neoarthrinium moseri]|uniref:uncharacterized protein n=1 Tax=Neoarthrinium moseri TaxID=1658444 RepID=UPI001FDE43EC|nr:uncharacterized protein JN550_003214 [Neoarthrinium moseri]KAI1873945.1 hypothetical protein JN550_003214 [Neoarthrinium moseri]
MLSTPSGSGVIIIFLKCLFTKYTFKMTSPITSAQAVVTMTTTTETFHHFYYLPAELKDMIWDAAIRQDQPSAHFLRLSVGVSGRTKFSIPRNTPSVRGRLGHKVPNPSIYFLDHGLWTACRGSHARARRHFQEAKLSIPSNSTAQVHDVPEPMTTTPIYKSSSMISVHPQNDLVILQLRTGIRPLISLPPSMPFANPVSRSEGTFPTCSFSMGNVGLEYNPCWNWGRLAFEVGYDFRKDTTARGHLWRSIDYMWRVMRIRKLWFVDTRLRPKLNTRIESLTTAASYRKQLSDDPRNVFAAQDRLYVEVTRNEANDEESLTHLSAGDPFDLTQELFQIMSLYHRDSYDLVGGEYYKPDGHGDCCEPDTRKCPYPVMELGVLMCVPLAGGQEQSQSGIKRQASM